jgi:hypothetical protein
VSFILTLGQSGVATVHLGHKSNTMIINIKITPQVPQRIKEHYKGEKSTMTMVVGINVGWFLNAHPIIDLIFTMEVN